MLGLCDAILDNNGKIYINTPAYDVKNKGNFYETITKDYTIKSKYVVLASHYPFLNIPGFYFTKMYQNTSYVIGIKTKKKLPYGMYINVKEPIYSFRTAKAEGHNLLLLGGSGHKTGNDISYDSTYGILEQKAKELYPDCEILYKWNTRDCITLDKIPYIGSFSKLMPNLFIGTGFNKWGMTSSNVAANIVTDNILGIDNPYAEIFSSTRMAPIKNKKEVKNILKQSANSLLLDKLKIPSHSLSSIAKGHGKIINVNNQKVGIYIDENRNIFAVDPICTHLGCLLSWNDVDKTWDCPCHGSRFNYLGHNIYDPAIKNLRTIKIITD